jgi:hypothetical protein
MPFAELDPRIIKVGIEIKGRLKIYEDLTISATGTKYANALQNECEVKITNVDKATRDYILTETSPFNANKTPKILTIDAGRKSYGTSRIFVGNIVNTAKPSEKNSSEKVSDKEKDAGASQTPSSSQPPDITLTLKCLTANFKKGDIISRNQPGQAKLSQIAQQVASDLQLALDFQATDKLIANYSHSGAALKQVDKLNEMGPINAYVDDDVLIVKNSNSALTQRVKILSSETGLIGIPEITERGIKVKYLLDNQTILGGRLRLVSKIYPHVNGDYSIYKLSFEIANRDTPFYWVAEAKRL